MPVNRLLSRNRRYFFLHLLLSCYRKIRRGKGFSACLIEGETRLIRCSEENTLFEDAKGKKHHLLNCLLLQILD